MVNKKILKELEKNKKGHIIFESQEPRDLDELNIKNTRRFSSRNSRR